MGLHSHSLEKEENDGEGGLFMERREGGSAGELIREARSRFPLGQAPLKARKWAKRLSTLSAKGEEEFKGACSKIQSWEQSGHPEKKMALSLVQV